MEDDRRGHLRHSCLVDVHGMHGERFFAGRARDLSASGAFVETGTMPARGELVYLLFDVPPRLYRIVGRALGSRGGATHGFGVTFETGEDKALAVARALAGEARDTLRRPVLRSHLRFPCQVQLQGAVGSGIFEAMARDVSPVGAFLVTRERHPIGTFVTLRFRGPRRQLFDAPGVVRWQRAPAGENRPGGVGVAFLREERALCAAIKRTRRRRNG